MWSLILPWKSNVSQTSLELTWQEKFERKLSVPLSSFSFRFFFSSSGLCYFFLFFIKWRVISTYEPFYVAAFLNLSSFNRTGKTFPMRIEKQKTTASTDSFQSDNFSSTLVVFRVRAYACVTHLTNAYLLNLLNIQIGFCRKRSRRTDYTGKLCRGVRIPRRKLSGKFGFGNWKFHLSQSKVGKLIEAV